MALFAGLPIGNVFIYLARTICGSLLGVFLGLGYFCIGIISPVSPFPGGFSINLSPGEEQSGEADVLVGFGVLAATIGAGIASNFDYLVLHEILWFGGLEFDRRIALAGIVGSISGLAVVCVCWLLIRKRNI